MAKKYLDFEGLSHFKGKLDVVLAAMGERLVEMYYTKGEVDELIGDLQFGIIKKVDALPAVGEEHVIYLVPKEAPATGFDEWIWVSDENKYELIGDTNIDLSDYYTKSEVDAFMTELDNAVEQAERLNVELEGSVITVTDKDGNESEIDLLDATNERVYIEIGSNDPDFNPEGIGVNVFYEQETTPRYTLTTDSNGHCQTDIPNGTKYRLVFPTIVGYDTIGDVNRQAHISTRTIEVQYKVTVPQPEVGEKLTIIVQRNEQRVFSKIEGVTVTITYDDESRIYETDAIGEVKVTIPYNKEYKVEMQDLSNDGLYLQSGKYVYTLYSESFKRNLLITYKDFESGVYVITNNNQRLSLTEFEELRSESLVSNADAKLIEVFTGQLANVKDPVTQERKSGVFCLDIDGLCAWNYPKLYVKGNEVTFNSIPTYGNVVESNYYYDGYTATLNMASEQVSLGIVAEAVNYALSQQVEIGDGNGGTLKLNGFLGSLGQWTSLWDVVGDVDSILESVRPDNYILLSGKTEWKNTSAQRDKQLYNFSNRVGQVTNYNNNSKLTTVPFYAYENE